ncbi:MAG: hypothetical protein E7323_13270 [Clostridiales bacterium]|nr:hypothetical protein [Clostridiales bacterium]
METKAANKPSFVNKRLLCAALIPAVIFALICTFCGELRTNLSFAELSWVDGQRFLVLLLLFSAVLVLLFGLMNRQAERSPKPETLFGRITGNGFVVFLFLLACWVPVWLAFWPGHFSADSITQFYSYYNEDHSTHHPLLHTLLLGFCMMLGIDASPEGYATNGLALYCGIQMIVVAGCVAYAIGWLKRRGVPVWVRLLITLGFGLSPFFAPWTFYSQKDVIFGVLVLVFCLQLLDLWQFQWKAERIIGFVIIAVLMMLFRNNGVYALVLMLPFAIWWLKGKRLSTSILLVVCAGLYFAANSGLVAVLDAESGSKVEILSTPLQQIARTLRDDPSAAEMDTDDVLGTLYGDVSIAECYDERISDPVKWPVDYDLLDENIPGLLSLWARMLPSHFGTYVEAFLTQNLPYLMPGSQMYTSFDFTVEQPEWFPIEVTSYLPQLRALYETYDETMTFAGIPGTSLLADPAVQVWLCIIGFAFAAYRKERGLMTAFVFLLALWFTCLLGPVAIMRYLLGLYYTVPVLLGYLMIPRGKGPAEEPVSSVNDPEQ